jgi:hypothetical protein
MLRNEDMLESEGLNSYGIFSEQVRQYYGKLELMEFRLILYPFGFLRSF